MKTETAINYPCEVERRNAFTGSVFRFMPAVNCRRKGCEHCGWNPMVAKKRLEERFHDASHGLRPLPAAAHVPPISSLFAFPTVVWEKEQNDCNKI